VACCEFEERLSECKSLLTSLNGDGVGQLEIDRVCNWQVRFVGTGLFVF
jgi:midasin